MATTFIDIDDQKPLGRQLVRSAQLLREGRESLQHALDHFTHMVDGNGTDTSHFTLPVSEAVYPSNAHAKASWDETQSLNAVIENAEAAILQWCAKHGV
jgi:hypothetical protein